MDKIILICATGRSGSTTLQRIINTIPNSNICGENFGAINSLLEFYKRIKYSSFHNIPGHLKPASYDDIISKNIKPAWYNSYNFNQVIRMIRIMITNMFKNSTNTNVWGFKEIRYDAGNIKYIKEFKELFPQTKVIIQIRENTNAQSKSGWHKNNKNAILYLNKLNKQLIDFYNENKTYCYLTSFEKMFDKNNMKNIFNFIDCSEHYNEKKIDDVLNNNIKDK
jgi:hypothetical protein